MLDKPKNNECNFATCSANNTTTTTSIDQPNNLIYLIKSDDNNNNQSDIVGSEILNAKNDKISVNYLVEYFDSKMQNADSFNLNKAHRLLENAIHWCLVNGFVLIPKERKHDEIMYVSYLPFTLFPSPFKRSDFQQVIDLQPHINQLVYNMAQSTAFLEKAFENFIEIDEFVNSLWSILKKAQKTGYNQKLQLIISRCDYMLHKDDTNGNAISMKQVEINTIAAGFGYVGGKASDLHREIIKWTNNHVYLKNLPQNFPLQKLAQGFVEANRLYDVKSSIVLFVVLDYEINIADQRHLEYEINKQNSSIEVYRCTLLDLDEFGRLDQENRLFYKEREVSIVYFRAGYDPSHYKSQKEWDSLLKIEMSRSIKCPSVSTFLAGFKKIQEYISRDENLLQICNNDVNMANSLKAVFVNFFKLDSIENIKLVYENPDRYVLKPQREGGGNNLYSSQIKEFLAQVLSNEASQPSLINNSICNENQNIPNKDSFIVMDLIKPVATNNFIISSKKQKSLKTIQSKFSKIKISNELGIYGVLLRDEKEVFLNEACGYCLRSKPEEENENGVMCGAGALDSIIFID